MRDSTVLWFRPFSIDLGILHEIWDHERYTPGPIDALARHGIVVDIGAHIGLFSVFASRELKADRIVSVEPDPVNFDMLSRNISANHMEHAAVLQAAIAGQSGDKWIHIDLSNTGGHSSCGQVVPRTLVKTVTLAELFEAFSVSECSLLKIDCEGAEMEIFDTAPDRLLKRVSAISLEYHLDAYSPERLEIFRKRLERSGFVVEVRPTGKTFGMLYGIRPI